MSSTTENNAHGLMNLLSIQNTTISGSVDKVLSDNKFETYQFIGEYPELHEFLSPLDPENRHRSIRDKLAKDTGEWFVRTAEFKAWYTGTGSPVMCCIGEPGVGKSSLICRVIDWLRASQNKARTGVSFIYCDYQAAEKQTVGNLLGALLAQIITYLEPQHEIIRTLRKRRQNRQSLSPEETVELIQRTVNSGSFSTACFCVDGLDELESGKLIRLLRSLAGICTCQHSVVRVLLSGRRNAGVDEAITRHLCNASPPIPASFFHVSTTETCPDIQTFLEQKLEEDRYTQLIDPGFKETIFETLAGGDSTFLLASLHIERLLKKNTKPERKEALHKTTLNLNSTYEAMVKRIISEDNADAMKILQWMLFCVRPITLQELRYALAVRSDTKDLDPNEDLPPLTIVDVTSGLVSIDYIEKNSIMVRFVHLTFQEHLLANASTYFPTGHALLTETTLTYLSFDALSTTEGRNRYKLDQDLYPFSTYALQNWGHHARQCDDERVFEKVCDFLQGDKFADVTKLMAKPITLIGSWLDVVALRPNYYETLKGIEWEHRYYCSPLHAASFFGLDKALTRILSDASEADTPFNAVDTAGSTALSIAVQRKQIKIIELLLACNNVDPNVADKDGMAPLHHAAQIGALEIVNLFLQHKSTLDINLADAKGMTPLMLAVFHNHPEVVKRLLTEKDININAVNADSETALLIAVKRGWLKIVEILLEQDEIDLNLADKRQHPDFCCLGI